MELVSSPTNEALKSKTKIALKSAGTPVMTSYGYYGLFRIIATGELVVATKTMGYSSSEYVKYNSILGTLYTSEMILGSGNIVVGWIKYYRTKNYETRVAGSIIQGQAYSVGTGQVWTFSKNII